MITTGFLSDRYYETGLLLFLLAVTMFSGCLHGKARQEDRFVPNDFLRSLGRENIMEVLLGDQTEKEVTVLFCDDPTKKRSPTATVSFTQNCFDFSVTWWVIACTKTHPTG